MSLRTKILLMIGLTFTVLCGSAALLLYQVVYGNLRQLEQRNLVNNIARLDEALNQQMFHLDLLTLDWSNWDEMYEYAASPNRKFEQSNLNLRSLQTANYNVVAILRQNGRPVAYAQVVNGAYRFARELPPWAADFASRHHADNWGGCGFVRSMQYPLQVCMRPIKASSAQKKVANGWLLTARVLDEERLTALGKILKYPLELLREPAVGVQWQNGPWDVGTVGVRESRNYQYQVFRRIDDYRKQPLFWLRFEQERESLARIMPGLAWMVALVGTIMVAIFLGLYFWLRYLLVSRLAGISAALHHACERRDWQTVVPYLGDSDEIGRLARSIAQLFGEMSGGQVDPAIPYPKDDLTGLPSRNAFDQMLSTYWSDKRQQQGIALLLVSVDCFKRFNDRYGHLAGDRLLADLARVLKKELARDTDCIARYSGGEFVVILTDTYAETARVVAERMRDVVLELAVEHADSPLGVVTVSIGLTYAPAASGLSATDVLAGADRALHAAKVTGHNQIVAN